MISPLSQREEAVEIFNRLANLDLGDFEEALQLLFRLRRLDKQISNILTKVSRADAALIAGFRDEAIDCLSAAYNRRSGCTYAVLQRFGLLTLFIGNRERAVSLAKEILAAHAVLDIQVPPTIVKHIVTTALWAGDLSLLADAAKVEDEALTKNALECLGVIERLGLLEHFSNHQKIIAAILNKYQMKTSIDIIMPETADEMIIAHYFFDGTKIDRHTLENTIETELENYFKNVGLDGSEWSINIGYVISEAPRHTGAR